MTRSQRSAGTLSYTAGGLLLLFFWLLFGDFAIAMRERSALPSVTELLRQHQASNLVMGLLKEGVPALVGLLLVPLVALRSDRHRGPHGRRLPFLLLPTPVAALAMMGIGLCPDAGAALHGLLGAGSPGRDACVLMLFSVCWIVFECMALVTMALFTALIADVVPAAYLGRFFGCFRIVSLSAGIVFQRLIFSHTDTHLREIFLGIGLFYGLAFTLMCLRVKEGEYPAPPPLDASQGFIAQTRGYLRDCFSEARYRWAFAAIAFGTLAPLPFNSFYQVYSAALGMPKQALGDLTAYAFALSIGLAFFIGWAVDRFTPLKVVIGALTLYALTMGGGYLLIDGRQGFDGVYMAHVVMSGIYFTASASLPMMLFPRLRFSQFASAAGIVMYLSQAIVGPLQGRLLDASGSRYELTLLGSALFAVIALVLHLKVLATLRSEGASVFDEKAQLDRVLAKLARTAARVQAEIPYIAPEGRWDDWSERDIGWWTNGFWPGLLWLGFRETGDERMQRWAQAVERKLDAALDDFHMLHHDVGFMWQLSAVAQHSLLGTAESKRRGMKAAASLASRFNLAGRFIRAWNPETWPEGDTTGWAIIDCLMNLPLLHWGSAQLQDPRWRQIASAHTETVIEHFLHADGSSRHIVEFNAHQGGFVKSHVGQAYSASSAWSRGAAWALHGLALAARDSGRADFRAAACRVANFFIANLPADAVPGADFKAPLDAPNPKDSSAAACAAGGLLVLAAQLETAQATAYREAARRMLASLSTQYAAPEEHEALLLHGCTAYHPVNRGHSDTPLIYGDYFYLEALLMLNGRPGLF